MKDALGSNWKLTGYYPMYGKLWMGEAMNRYSRLYVLKYTTAMARRRARRDGYVRPTIRCYQDGCYYADGSCLSEDELQRNDTFEMVPKDY